jgi:excisionase family DNA binding protein
MHFVTDCCKISDPPQMMDFLTTRELASLLRVKERKVYDLVAAGALPVRRVTGKLLFPRDEIDVWLGAQSRHGGPNGVADGDAAGPWRAAARFRRRTRSAA